MEDDVLSISGMFGAGVIEEEEEKKIHNNDLIRRASVRIFRSLKRVRRSFSGSLSSIISRQSVAAENNCQSQIPNTSKATSRRPWSFAFGEEVRILRTPTSIGKIIIIFIIDILVVYLIFILLFSFGEK